MKFVSLYKGITLTVQRYYTNCTKENVLSVQGCTRFLIGFIWFLNNLNLTLRGLFIVLFFFFYQTMSLRHSLQKLTHRK